MIFPIHGLKQRVTVCRDALDGGLLVYSTCSLEPEENEGVVAEVPGDRIVERLERIPGRDPGDGFLAFAIR